MPTNKLWIEHTERAAWQSVEALRRRLSDAEQRAERLTPPIEGWAVLAAELDKARERHALSGNGYAELLRDALAKLAQRETAARPEPPGPATFPAEPLRREAPAWLRHDDDEFSDPRSSAERRLFRAIRRRARELRRDRRADLDALLSDIENRLQDLPDLDSAELGEVAADLAALFLRLRPDLDPDDDE